MKHLLPYKYAWLIDIAYLLFIRSKVRAWANWP